MNTPNCLHSTVTIENFGIFLDLRDYMFLCASRENGQAESEMEIIEWPFGPFMGEQFPEGGFQLPSGRLIFTMWGIAIKNNQLRLL